MGFLGHLKQSWRSVFAILLAYVISVVLFVFETGWFNSLINWASDARLWFKHVVGEVSPKGESAFSFISDFTTYITLMIVFVRVVVISAVLWISERIVGR